MTNYPKSPLYLVGVPDETANRLSAWASGPRQIEVVPVLDTAELAGLTGPGAAIVAATEDEQQVREGIEVLARSRIISLLLTDPGADILKWVDAGAHAVVSLDQGEAHLEAGTRSLLRLADLLTEPRETSDHGNLSEEAYEQVAILQAIVGQLAEGVIVADAEGQLSFLNAAAERILGVGRVDLPPDERARFFGIYHTDTVTPLPGHALPTSRALRGEHFRDVEFFIRNEQKPEGTWISTSARPIVDESGERIAGAVVFRDITHRKTCDRLTGLPNKRVFTQRVERAIQGLGDGEQLAVMLLDLDRFRMVNESLGHGLGDDLLIAAAERLNELLQDRAFLARAGGDKFGILVPPGRDVERVVALAESVQETLGECFMMGDQEVYLSASAGVAIIDHKSYTTAAVIRDADTALHRAKARGLGRLEVFDERMKVDTHSLMQLEVSLRRAVQRREFEVFYQPIVDLTDGRLAGVEALVRWRHPERGLVSPAEFIPVAERTELIVPIGREVLIEACRQGADWAAAGREDMFVSVNLSARQFGDVGLVDDVAQALEDSGLDPERLHLEVTESVLMDDARRSSSVLSHLRDLGIGLAIDDFGTGYSSLSYLQRFPVQRLKIDQSFVAQLDRDRNSARIIGAIVGLAHSLDMKVVAEGIETRAQLEGLRRLDCPLGQGFLFSRPCPPGALTDLIETPPDWGSF